MSLDTFSSASPQEAAVPPAAVAFENAQAPREAPVAAKVAESAADRAARLKAENADLIQQDTEALATLQGKDRIYYQEKVNPNTGELLTHQEAEDRRLQRQAQVERNERWQQDMQQHGQKLEDLRALTLRQNIEKNVKLLENMAIREPELLSRLAQLENARKAEDEKNMPGFFSRTVLRTSIPNPSEPGQEESVARKDLASIVDAKKWAEGDIASETEELAKIEAHIATRIVN